ncbi:MAG TPA: excinuclease ABC subunit UvrA [Paenalcaligenes sp.]|nr:excinuclease ABC subunit UvrA [Paenalcaligenes sp.]
MTNTIRIIGAKQNNLKNLNIDFNSQEITVITGVSGSGKSSLAFDTLYAEGQRRYVETFSPYARQFLDRMDKPQVDRIEGVLPAIAIDQINPIRNSRSSVGTMTELNDYLKLFYARLGRLFCQQCSHEVTIDSPQSIVEQLASESERLGDPRWVLCFKIDIPDNFSTEEIQQYLQQQGYTRTYEPANDSKGLYVIQDRFRSSRVDSTRLSEGLEAAFMHGRDQLHLFALDDERNEIAHLHFRASLYCARCHIEYSPAHESTFSYNSPLGACETCRGFGRVMGIDYGLVIPDENKSLLEGAIRPWHTERNKKHQKQMEALAPAAGVRLSAPWNQLSAAEKQWVIQGDPDWKRRSKDKWYGVQRFFDYLEKRSYRMHVRVMLSNYRSYTPCTECLGARLKTTSLLWRIGNQDSKGDPQPYQRFIPHGCHWTPDQVAAMPGLHLYDLMRLPIGQLRDFFSGIAQRHGDDPALELILSEVQTRLDFLCRVGVDYLHLDRQSRTLSGGEVQRINLTTALGSSLVNTLFVLDEPSIGLHPQDMHRVIDAMKRLKTHGNTLVVVEHDPQVMVAADRILDMGPGPGPNGGQILFDGAPTDLRAAHTLTGDYLAGRRQLPAYPNQPVTKETPSLYLRGVRAHNLKNIDVRIPVDRFTVICGVSGSGKSTLIENVLYPALLKHFGQATEAPGTFDSLEGADQFSEVVFVDQSPIGRTARSNPASYVGAFDPIRRLFARTALAKERGYTAGTFSFNTGNGRCPGCGGSGFEHIEMQFLSDVYLRCPDCDGRRYRHEILEVHLEHHGQRASIADVLAMTIDEAAEFFTGLQEVQRVLAPLLDVGLGYLQLGQPVPTLSGGEAQRLKLAGYLAETNKRPTRSAGLVKKGRLFLFDEPTTGLHFDDIAKLMSALRSLMQTGHTVVVIEHNLDVILSADWVLELGPKGGHQGGELIAECAPQTLESTEKTPTAVALREYQQEIRGQEIDLAHDADETVAPVSTNAVLAVAEPSVHTYDSTSQSIEIIHAREHNLKNIQVSIPRDQFTVVTGVSGSGKSTLAFDILFNEGQRRFLESLNAYARSIVQPAGQPDVDAIYGIPPTVAIEQRISRGGHKSTVGTMTEIHHFLRLLYLNLATQYCPDCQIKVEAQSPEQILAHILQHYNGQKITLLAPLVVARKGYYTDLAQWANSKGYPQLRVNGDWISTRDWPRLERYKDHYIELPVAQLTIASNQEQELRHSIQQALEYGHGHLQVLVADHIEDYSVNRSCPQCQRSFPAPDPRLFSYNSRYGWCEGCYGTGLKLKGFDAEQTGEEQKWLDDEHSADAHICNQCHGQRLNPVALNYFWQEHSIAALSAMTVQQASSFFAGLSRQGREAEIARDIFNEIEHRLHFLLTVGLGYLGMDRSAQTLSGGEAQRIRLAAQLGSNLQGVCYVLDEPTIGLHPRDNQILLQALQRLQAHGNTLVVVEHDEDTICAADHIIDLGPGAGIRGGQIVASGTIDDIREHPESMTGQYLRAPIQHSLTARRPIKKTQPMLEIRGARVHNLKDINAQLPLQRLTVITGVSGSGKSSLAHEVLLKNLKMALHRDNKAKADDNAEDKTAAHSNSDAALEWHNCDSLQGWESLERVLEVDQTPIGKTPRSCPATYVGFWDHIRRLFAQTREARMRGWNASRFSFNTGQGRCDQCGGRGMLTMEMSFLPDITVPCDNCHGLRFNPDTLGILWQGKNIGEVLRMDVDTAVEFFSAHPRILQPLRLMQDVGLGYLTLGQPSPTLSGGEAQRLKLVTELSKARVDEGLTRSGPVQHSTPTLYVLDEPTVGLAMADVEKLLHVLHRLCDAGHTIVVIEHHPDIMAQADWIIDLGPEGGDEGGHIVVQGPLKTILKTRQSYTGQALQSFLSRHESVLKSADKKEDTQEKENAKDDAASKVDHSQAGK